MQHAAGAAECSVHGKGSVVRHLQPRYPARSACARSWRERIMRSWRRIRADACRCAAKALHEVRSLRSCCVRAVSSCPAVCSACGALPDIRCRLRSACAQRVVPLRRAWAARRQGCFTPMGSGAGFVRFTPRPISGTLITSWVWVTGVRSVPSRWNHGLISAAALPQDVRRSAARRGAKHHVRWLRRGGLTIDSLRADHAAAGAALRRQAGVRCSACTAAGGRTHPATSRRVLAALGMCLCTAAAFSASAACWRRRVTATPGGTFLVVRRRVYTARRACAEVWNGRRDTLEAHDCIGVAAPSL
jgi:hypothetical protein